MRLLREPLLHFLVLGAALFALFGVVGGDRAPAPDRIVVQAADVSRLTEGFARTWQRPPTPEELAALVQDHVNEEVLYREALAMGLDRDDTIVRRRLRQKLEFLLDAEASVSEPSVAELEAHLLAQRERFEETPRVSFQQVYLSTERRGVAARADAERLLAELRSASHAGQPAGDPSLLAPAQLDLAPADVASLFGGELATRVFELPVGVWQGPLASGHGLHLVLVSERSPGRLPPLAEVREAVAQDWQAERRREALAKRLAALRARYAVSVEWPAFAKSERGLE